jgi:hypothetical protein
MKIEIDTNLDSEEEIMGAIALVQQTLAKRKDRLQSAQNIKDAPQASVSSLPPIQNKDISAEKKPMPKIVLEEYSDLDDLRHRQKEKAAQNKQTSEKTEKNQDNFKSNKKKNDTDDIPKVEIVEY